MVAIEKSSLQTIAFFFENISANFGLVLQQKTFGRNIFHFAACNPDEKVFEFVILKTVKFVTKEIFQCMINDETDDGDTPLHFACKTSHLTAVTILLQHGAELNNYNKENQTPIFNAVEKDAEKIVEALIKSGADVTTTDKWDKNPLFYAKSKAVAELLIEAAAIEYPSVVKLRVKYINAKGFNFKRTPIMYAVKYGHLELVKFLFENGALLDELDKYNNSILHFLPLLNDQVEIAKFLIENGCKYLLTHRNKKHEHEDREHLTSLLEAVKVGRIKLTKYFINEGSDVRVKNLYGQTILHLAAESRDKSMIDAIKDSVSHEDFIYLLNSRDSNCRLPSDVDSQTGDYLKIFLRKYENARKSLNLELKSFEDRDFFNEYFISTFEDILFNDSTLAVPDKLLELLQKEWPQPHINKFFHMNLFHYFAYGKDLKIHEIASKYRIKLEKPVGSEINKKTDGIGCVTFSTIKCDMMEIFPDIKTELLAEIFKQSYNSHFTDELIKESIEETISNGFRWRFGGEWACISANKNCELIDFASRVVGLKNRFDAEIDERKYLVWMISGYIYE